MPPFSQATLDLLRCPVTQSNLTVASKEQVASLNAQIAEGTVVNQLGQTVTEAVDSILINADGRIGCAVRAGIIQMIADEAIAMPDK